MIDSKRLDNSQLTFDLVPKLNQGREDLIESSSNALAIAMIDVWPNWPGPITILSGPNGSGKSHIASVWAALSCSAVIVADQLVKENNTQLIDGCEKNSLVIEDVTAGVMDETVLFHILNVLKENDNHCLITSTSGVGDWKIGLPDLKSRLQAAQMVNLEEPDELFLGQVMMKHFSDRQVQVEAKVIQYCMLRMERSLDAARRLAIEMDRLAMIEKKEIGLRIAANALQNLGMG